MLKRGTVAPDACFGELFRFESNLLPQEMRPAGANPHLDNLTSWIRQHRYNVNAELIVRGALLFRGFPVETPADFERIALAASDSLIDYRERSSPRSQITNKIYTSTDYPASEMIFPHNELSYAITYPLHLFFCCLNPAAHGGETPLVDIRKVTQRISEKVKLRFREKKWMYVRNFRGGLGLSWETAFQTTDRSAVERYCREQKVECEWKSGNRLRTCQVRPAFVQHARTGECLWFNHAAFFNVSTLPSTIREVLTTEFADKDLPNNTYYGDGSKIEESVLDELRDAYEREMVTFQWEKGDVVMLDNVLTAHARMPYSGGRTVLVSMAEPVTRSDI
jgi:alpha-ketoglutarate-dependent taurine dioxygenase